MLFNCPPRKLSDRPRLSRRLVLTLCPAARGIIDGAATKQLYPWAASPSYNPLPGRSSLIHERNLLFGKMLAHVLEQVLHTVRHGQRSYESLLMVTKSPRDAFLVYIQPRKHIILLGYKCFLSHAECLLVQWLLLPPIVPEHSRLGVDIHHTGLRKACALSSARLRLRNPG